MSGEGGPLGKGIWSLQNFMVQTVVIFEDRLRDLTFTVQIFLQQMKLRHEEVNKSLLMSQFHLLQNANESWTFLIELV